MFDEFDDTYYFEPPDEDVQTVEADLDAVRDEARAQDD